MTSILRSVKLHGVGLGGLAVILSVPMVLLTCAILVLGQARRDTFLRSQVRDSAHRRDLVQSILLAANDAETGQRGYMLTGDPHYLAPYLAAKTQLPSLIADLRSEEVDSSQRSRVDDIQYMAAAKLAELAQTVALARMGHRDTALKVVRGGSGQAYMVEIRRLAGALTATESADLASRVSTLDRDTAQTQTLTASLIAIMILIVSAAGGMIGLAVRERDARGRRLAIAHSELACALAAAEAAVAMKAEFLANMSHELRTPMTGVLGYAELLMDREDLSLEARRYVECVNAAGKGLLATVNDILDFSKLEAGQVEILRAPMSPRDLLDETIVLFAPQADMKGLVLESVVDESVPEGLLADATRLRQVLLNLIGNALKFTAVGRVAVHLAYDGDRLRCEVRDTGPGMTPDQASRLFQRFSQVEEGPTRTGSGTGLGLAICRGLTQAMGGEIGVKSTAGDGSRFWFEIPAEPAIPALIGEVDESHVSIVGVRVLVVDDHEMNRTFVRLVLSAAGAQIVDAADGAAAVQAALEAPFDVILMDLQMPGMSGAEAATRIRDGAGPNADIPILAFTASGSRDAWRRSPSHVFNGQLPKPLTPKSLMEAVASWSGPDVPAAHVEDSDREREHA